MPKTRKKVRREVRPRRTITKPLPPRQPAIGPSNAGQHQATDLTPLTASLETISKGFAIIALRFAPVRPKTVQDRALFLDALGMKAVEIAAILGSTPRSIGELVSRARRGRRRAQ